MEFLNFNIHAGEGLNAHELFSDDVFDSLKAIAKAFVETQVDNGHRDGVSTFMVEDCDENPGLCLLSDLMAGC
ncbi:MAG: hypothetical protein ABJH85_02290 [Paracoccaceae bacterium]